MKKYPKYKDSGVEWIGEIPEGWEVKKLKHLTDYKNGAAFKSDDFSDESEIPVIRIGDVSDNINFLECAKVPLSFLNTYSDFVIQKNSILIGLTGGTIGKSCHFKSDVSCLLNQRVCSLVNNESLNNKLLYYYVKSQVFITYIFYNCYGGGQDNIGKSDIINMVFPLPSQQEQQQIVTYLDHKTTLIDQIISGSEKKIELLKEQRTAIINHAVTKGLNPKVKLKDSGVEWIGEIPEGWSLVQLNHIAKKITNGFVGPTRDILVGSGVRYIQGIHIKKDQIEFTPNGDYYVTKEWSENHSRSILKEGDVLLVQSGTIGSVGYVSKDYEGANCHALIIVSFEKNEYLGKFFLYFLKSSYSQSFLQTIKTGEILEHLNSTKVKFIKTLIPPLQEQQQIVTYLDQKTKEIDDLISSEQKRIELMKEYRQSLISEVVTGKIKVTNE